VIGSLLAVSMTVCQLLLCRNANSCDFNIKEKILARERVVCINDNVFLSDF
jgi:hypothetical protein